MALDFGPHTHTSLFVRPLKPAQLIAKWGLLSPYWITVGVVELEAAKELESVKTRESIEFSVGEALSGTFKGIVISALSDPWPLAE
tara:strand:- start:51 stop:308 length:258 start_codon:yes stop_codon:yes gene_type:complete